MTKMKKNPTILKPTIDEKLVLQFATAVSPPKSRPAADDVAAKAAGRSPKKLSAGNERQIALTIKKDLYDRIASEAALKNRTVEEHLIKHLTKRYGK
jgi:hypothetical protein